MVCMVGGANTCRFAVSLPCYAGFIGLGSGRYFVPAMDQGVTGNLEIKGNPCSKHLPQPGSTALAPPFYPSELRSLPLRYWQSITSDFLDQEK